MTRKEYALLSKGLKPCRRHFIFGRTDVIPGTLCQDHSRARFMKVFKIIEDFMALQTQTTRIADLGCYPGTLAELLRKKYNKQISIDGVGLGLTDEFRAELKDIYDNIYEVELDPTNLQQVDIRKPQSIPTDDGAYDIIFAGEVFEHLYSPLHFIAECHRILGENGIVILTTPNICYFGNVCRLLLGKSIHESLKDSHIYLKSNWRPHMRVYASDEIKSLFVDAGFVEYAVYLMDNQEGRFITNWKIRLKLFFIGLAGVIPRFRNQYVGVFKKVD